MRRGIMVGLAAAGLGFLYGTDPGRRLREHGRSLAERRWREAQEAIARARTKREIRAAAERAPDTAMAHAFEEAAA